MITKYIENANFEDTGFSYTLSLISGKHKMVILYCLMEFETVRFNELKRYLKTISDKTLSYNLKELESDHLIIRTEYPQIPPKVEYSLSERGQSLMKVLDQLCIWGEEHREQTLALYPCPVIVVGAMVNDKPTWTLVAHAGTVAHSHLMVSLVQAHYINQGIRENKKLSVNVVDESWLAKADKMGTISGSKVDKSEAFAWTIGENGAPLIDDAKVSIECEVDGNYELENFDHFICKILATYADEIVLNEKGKIDYHTFKPVLFEFPTYEYFVTGEKVGDCAKMNK